ncbi:MAG: 3-deoxy-D-manno-octulosonic acid transferase [Bacteroidales bacterium]|jgi:3-deoxy-D-manno-octulosonic-acid transferase|nr:3-deoxy-D-manno-octulosonic acid transferase [Bacteroidales bacterium]
MRLLYTFALKCYALGIALWSCFHKKARLWHQGQQQVWKTLNPQLFENKEIIWFHCASLGEYEQGKPLMQRIKKEHPNAYLMLTFFSPSGFETIQHEPLADMVSYLPLDTPKNARRFIQIVKPKCAFFVKYEYWYNYMQELNNQHIPLYYISAIFRPNQYFFKFYGSWFVSQLRKVTHFFVQNEISVKLLNSIGIRQVMLTGDTRFDRVYAIANQAYSLEIVEQFQQDKKLLIVGSSWEQDEELLVKLYPRIAKDFKLVIAPHQIHEAHIQQIKDLFSHYQVVCYQSEELQTDRAQALQQADILIVDCIGLLSKIYKYSTISYIGGAFKTGLHNTLEAAVFGVPLFFGPNYQKFDEAVTLVALGGAFSINSAEEMYQILEGCYPPSEKYQQVCDICKKFVADNIGAAEKILLKINPFLG